MSQKLHTTAMEKKIIMLLSPVNTLPLPARPTKLPKKLPYSSLVAKLRSPIMVCQA